jgi:hypothetical protein
LTVCLSLGRKANASLAGGVPFWPATPLAARGQ